MGILSWEYQLQVLSLFSHHEKIHSCRRDNNRTCVWVNEHVKDKRKLWNSFNPPSKGKAKDCCFFAKGKQAWFLLSHKPTPPHPTQLSVLQRLFFLKSKFLFTKEINYANLCKLSTFTESEKSILSWERGADWFFLPLCIWEQSRFGICPMMSETWISTKKADVASNKSNFNYVKYLTLRCTDPILTDFASTDWYVSHKLVSACCMKQTESPYFISGAPIPSTSFLMPTSNFS